MSQASSNFEGAAAPYAARGDTHAAANAAADPNPEYGVLAALGGGIAAAVLLRLIAGGGDEK